MYDVKPLFSDKYLAKKFVHLELFKIADLDKKRDTISRWQKSLRNSAIAQSKEESLQGSFLQQFFVEILGYDNQKQDAAWTLEIEQKTLDNKKMDGALGFFKIDKGAIFADVRVVIELKNALTDLDKPQQRKEDKRTPVQQAFDYANSLGGSCRWIIVSNFKEIRLYFQTDRTRYQKFEILNLHKEEEFKQFYFLLNHARLISETGDSVTDKLYFERQAEEIAICENFYQDYKQARLDFFHSLKAYNPAVAELVLLNKAQKMIDRIIFVHFCENYNLISSYFLRSLIENAKRDVLVREKDKIYRRLRFLFEAINEGHPELEINKFNGGLFAEDDVLNSLAIDDAILEPVLKLVEYDLASDLGVNILGHIFEQSISDIEELKAEITGEVLDKKQGKRKKDGIYYTPDYITRYIVEEAIGGWLKDRRTELNEAALPELTEADLASSRIIERGKNKGKFECNAAITAHLDFYDAYKIVLEQIKVVDPACGSGAFLNQAFDFLYTEGKRVNEKIAQLRCGQFSALDLGKQILENNLFGVDLNEESIEITKLSLWIKTANRYRELTTLDFTIKCGNSLIDDESVAGNKAFVWEKEFKAVMEQGGFDIVIGNPPYLRLQGLKDAHFKQSLFYEKHYQAATGNYDIYVLFLEKAYQLLAANGNASFILPHKWLISEFGQGIRKVFIANNAVAKIDHFETHLVFEEATTYTCITTLTKKLTDNLQFRRVNPKQLKENKQSYTIVNYETLSADNWNLGKIEVTNLLNKLNQQPLKVSDVFEKIFQGIATSADNIYLIKGSKEGDLIKGYSKQLDRDVILEADFMKPLLKGEDISRYKKLSNQYYVMFPYLLNDDKAKPMTEDYIKTTFPKAYSYLKENEADLRAREHGKMNHDNWFLYIYPKSLTLFSKQKIISSEISLGSSMTYDENGAFYHATTVYSFIKKEEIKESYKYYLCLLNSSVLWFFLQNTGTVLRGGYFRFQTKYLMPFPLPQSPDDVTPFIEKTDIMLTQNKALQLQITVFLNFLQGELKLQKITGKLQTYYQLNWAEFKAELKKGKVDLAKLSLDEREQWLAKFETAKQKAVAIKTCIAQTDKEIDAMVYALYGLNAADIAIIEK